MRNTLYLVAIVAVIAVASHFAFQVERAGQPAFYLGMGVPTLILAILGVIRAYRDGIIGSWFGVKSGDITIGIVSAGLLFAASYAFTRATMPVGSARESWLARLYLQVGDPTMLRKNVTVVVAGIIVVAAAEEIVWRGLVTSLLEEKVGSRRAWVYAAVLYAVAHVPTIWALRDPVAGANPAVFIAALGAGLVWGGMTRRFERLWPAIISHAFFDWIVGMMFRLWGPSV